MHLGSMPAPCLHAAAAVTFVLSSWWPGRALQDNSSCSIALRCFHLLIPPSLAAFSAAGRAGQGGENDVLQGEPAHTSLHPIL